MTMSQGSHQLMSEVMNHSEQHEGHITELKCQSLLVGMISIPYDSL